MKFPSLQRRTIGLIVAIVPLLLLFIFVVMRSGPLAPIKVTVATVRSQSIAPELFGIGTIQARYTFKVGPTFAGKLKRLEVQVGDVVESGQVIGEMDAVDMDERISAQQAAINSAVAAITQAEAKQIHAQTQATRYNQLSLVNGTSEEMVSAKRQELAIANAGLVVAKQDLRRLQAEREALMAQKGYLLLVAPVHGLVTKRDVEPGSTAVAGQAVIEIIDPDSIWVNTRFDQITAEGLAADLPATIILRSRASVSVIGYVFRTEPLADPVTEETLAKVAFKSTPVPLPPLGELAEVTVQLPELAAAPTIPNAAIRTLNNQRGVWKLVAGKIRFVSLKFGRSDLAGNVQVIEGLNTGEQIIVYSEKMLTANSRLKVVEHLTKATP
ncbi:efflux RND transporter periplasmic adaptor subunit [Glaciecola sp. SC05]|uniref:efflux RND transporter periplasmic adaptor subunit n=1 Tax=Glaciecola sp. SC05 TaxID=1987355 RepID=UPI003527F0E2